MKIKDIAALAHVSAATVSRVINNNPGVTEPARRKVMRVIRETGYVPNLVGRNLRQLKSGKLLVMVPTISNPFYSEILRGIEEQARRHSYGTLVSITHMDASVEEEYLMLLATRQVDGVISLSSTLGKDSIMAVAEKHPFVQCCEPTPDAAVSCVMIDNEAAAREAVGFLLGKGRRRVAMLTGRFYRNSETAREAGYRRALTEAGIEINPDYIVCTEYTFETGREAAERLFSLPAPPDAVFCVSDSLAIGCIIGLRERGIRPGTDVDVIGFDNNSLSGVYNPTVSTVSQPRYELGRNAADLIMERVGDNTAMVKKIILPHRLILRESAPEK